MPEKASNPVWLRVSQAAAYANVSEKTVRRWLRSGALRAKRLSDRPGSVWLIERAAIDRFLQRTS